MGNIFLGLVQWVKFPIVLVHLLISIQHFANFQIQIFWLRCTYTLRELISSYLYDFSIQLNVMFRLYLKLLIANSIRAGACRLFMLKLMKDYLSKLNHTCSYLKPIRDFVL